MQATNRYNIPKRSRHYQSMIDGKLLPQGEIDYDKLNPVKKVFLNTKGTNEKEVRPELIEFLKYIENSTDTVVNHSKVKQIQKRVEQVKKSSEAEARYMTVEIYGAEKRQEGVEQGIEILILDNLEDGKNRDVIVEKLKKHFHLTEEEACIYFKRYAGDSKK